MNKEHHVIDYETLPNCTILVAEHYVKNEVKVFVIHELQNDFSALVDFLIECWKKEQWHVSFNGLGFDSQISEYILRNKNTLLKMPPHRIADTIYQKAQDVITRSNAKQFQEFPAWELSIKNVDVFAQNNWNNPSKMTSLKWAQCGMDWLNVQDMPIHHTTFIKTQEELDTVVSYCKNDVSSTKKIMQLCKDQINLRGALSQEYGIDLYSASEPRISKELFLHFISEKTGQKKHELKKISTKRDKIKVDSVLLPYVNFQRQEFKMLLNNFKNLVIDGAKLRGAFKYTVKYRGMAIEYGMGGLHGLGKPGIYEAKDGMIIMSSDVISYYPNLVIRNKWSPAHLPKEVFCGVYEWMFEERKKIPKKNPKNYVFKIALNSVFGLSLEPNNFLGDSQLGVAIVVNGQLSLSMLLEMLCEAIPDAQPLVANTDGLELMIPEEAKETYMKVCAEWEKITQLSLEHDQYKKMHSYDCNNFINEFTNGKTKCKGRFEFEPHDKYEIASLHKNKSFLIVPKAIYHYLINGIEPEQFLRDNRNIFDYCGFVRAKGQWQLTEYNTGADGLVLRPLQKTLRYYISKNGKKIIKVNKTDGREINIEAGLTKCVEFNLYQEKSWEEYGVDDKYYLEQIYKELEAISPKEKMQLELF